MNKFWHRLIAAAAGLALVAGCSSARSAAEQSMDASVERDYPTGTLYLSSRDFDGRASFMPDPSQPELMLMATCISDDGNGTPLMKVTQSSVDVTEFGLTCAEDDADGSGYGGMTPALFDPDGGEVTVEVDAQDGEQMVFRVLGYTPTF